MNNPADKSPRHPATSDNPSAVPADITPSATTQTYTVQPDDTLPQIAERLYGKPDDWQPIVEANRDQLGDSEQLTPGQILKIPAVTPDDAT